MKADENVYPHRSEILFLYDIFRCNPNGDPFENRPRQDLITGRIDVTDVRLKRTVRDYIYRYKHDVDKEDGLNIFVQVEREKALTAEKRYEEIFKVLPTPAEIEEAKKNLIKQCIDVRLFGALVPITKREEEIGAGIQITGAVQFNPGQSLHAAEVLEIAGTGGFAAKEEKRQKTFRREFIVPYALIGFYGVINENLAVDSGLNKSDVDILMEALWEGTKALHSRSKAFHHPRLLMRLDYRGQRQCGYFLDKLQLLLNKKEKEIRSPKDYTLDIGSWLQEISRQKDFLEHIYCRVDHDLPLKGFLTSEDLKKELEGLVKELEKLDFIVD